MTVFQLVSSGFDWLVGCGIFCIVLFCWVFLRFLALVHFNLG